MSHKLRCLRSQSWWMYVIFDERNSLRVGWIMLQAHIFSIAYVWGLPQSILLKVYSQTSLPSGMDNWKAVMHNLDCLQRGYAKLKQLICPSWAPFPQTNTPATTQVLDTSMHMDIDQNKHRPETCSWYNCNEKGHLSWHCQKPQKQWVQLVKTTEVNLKSLVAEAVVAAMDAWEVKKKAEESKEDF